MKIRLYKISFIILCFFIIDSVFHIGRIILGEGTDYVRIAIFLLLICLTLPFFLGKQIWVHNKYFLCILLYIFILFLAYCRSIFFSQNIEIANEFVTVYLYLFFLPNLYYSLRSKKELFLLLKIIIILGSFLSTLSFLLVFTNLTTSNLYPQLINFITKFELINLIFKDGNTLRIMFYGVLLQVAAIFFCLYFFLENGRKKYIVLLFLNLIGIFFTYSRGIIGGIFLGFIILLYNNKKLQNSKRVLVLVFLFIIAIIICLIKFLNDDIIIYFINRFFHNNETVNIETRAVMDKMLKSLISEHIIIGNGAGAHIPYRDGRVELVYHDIISKVGFLGLFIFIFPYILMIIFLYKRNNNKKKKSTLYYCLFSLLTSIMFASYSNPYFISSFGLLFYCLCMRLFVGKGEINFE